MDSESIRATLKPWTRACLDRDWDALLALCTPDVVFSPPAEASVSGDALRPWLDTFPVLKTFDLEIEQLHIQGSLAVAAGSGAWAMEIDGKLTKASFKFLDRFERGDDGTWRYAHVFWNMNAPLLEL
jgi:ketosteroid isomerase-like protein